ncbi:MAG: hypothetical protein Q6361_07210, partial [Candidatus Hermodarchaeota archaeon]|nr:hypothetical protein [Candidatus Hermodarchaeota archaeon]
MERYVNSLKTELATYERIEDLKFSKPRAYSLLLKVQELTDNGERVSATVLRQKSGMDTHYFHIIRDWLVAREYLTVEKQGRQRWFTVSDKCVDALDRRDMVMRLEEYSRRLYDVKSFEEEMEGLNNLFGEIFEYAWRRLSQYRDIEDYYLFLGAVEGSAFNHLNREVAGQIDEIKKGHLRGYLRDPFFLIERRFLPALYFDAVLARKLGHYLTFNHRFVLLALGDASEDELVKHNQEWVRRFMEEEMQGEDKPNAQSWRLIPRFTVKRELELRGNYQLLPEHAKLCNRIETTTYKEEYPAFYEKNQRLYSHDGFHENPLWLIDLHKAIENYA